MPLASLALTGVQALAQNKQNKQLKQDYLKAEANVQPVDPSQVALLDKFRRQEKLYRAGTDASSAFGMQNVNNATAQTQKNLVRGGFNSPADILRAQQAGNQGIAGVAAQAAGNADRTAAAGATLTNMIAGNVLQRQRELRDQAMARYEQGRQNMNNMVSGMIGTLPDMNIGMLKNSARGPFASPAMMTGQINNSLPAGRGMSESTGYTSMMQPNPIAFGGGSPLNYTPIGG